MNDLLNKIDINAIITAVSPFVLAILILVVGYILVKIIASKLRKSLKKWAFLEKILWSIGVETQQKTVALVISKIVFIILMLFVLVTFFDVLWLEAINTPIQNFIKTGLPWALSALWLVVVAWVAATLVKLLIRQGWKKINLDSKLWDDTELTDEDSKTSATGLTSSLSNLAYWFIILFFLPAILWALWQDELLAPITQIINQITGYIPNIIWAAAIFIIWWFIAKTLRKITTGVLSSLWADTASKKLGLNDFSVSKIVGTLVYVIILVPIIIQALDRLQIKAISAPATQMLNTIINALPGILAAIVIVWISYVIWKFISKLITELLSGLGFDKILSLVGLNNTQSSTSPSSMMGTLLFVYILLLAVIEAANKIGFTNISWIVHQFMGFATNILVGIIIFGIGIFLANLASKTIKSTSNSVLLPKIAKIAIIVLTTAMGLKQMGIADDIINLAFGLTLGAIAIAAALAIGLGSKDVAWQEVKAFIERLKK